MTADWRPAAELALARGRRFDRRIPSFLLRSPISRVGYWWGTAVGWIWGSLWSTGPVERRAGLWVFQGMPNWTFNRGGVCVGGCFLTGDARPSDAMLRHEAVHKAQWLRYGFLLPALYFLAGRDPLRNRFEIEAGLEDGNYVRRGRPQL
jgi:hypothetical protein